MLKPVGPRIKIKVIVQEEKTASGFIVSVGNKSEDVEIGEVVDIGHMAYKNISDETPWCKIGDKVLFQKYAGKIDPTDSEGLYRFLKDLDIIAVDIGE